MLTSAMPMAEYSIALRKRASLSVICLRSARKAYITMVIILAGNSIIKKGSQGAFSVTSRFCGVMDAGLRVMISETIITVTRNTRNASIRGRRTALHISRTITQVKGHGSQVIAIQLRASVTAMVASVSSSNFGLR